MSSLENRLALEHAEHGDQMCMDGDVRELIARGVESVRVGRQEYEPVYVCCGWCGWSSNLVYREVSDG